MVRKSVTQLLIPAVMLLLAAFVLVYTRGLFSAEYYSTEFLQWRELAGCSRGGVPGDLLGQMGSVGTHQEGSSDTHGICESEPFDLRTDLLEISLAGLTIPERYLAKNSILFHEGDNTPVPVTVQSSRTVSGWSVVRLNYHRDRDAQNQRVFLRLVGDDTRKGWIGVRNSVAFLSTPIPEIPKFSISAIAIAALLVGLLLAASVAIFVPGSTSSVSLFGFFVIVSLLLHGRMQLYFHWDEWHVLERFMQKGLAGVVYTHNEHFLPLYFLYLYVQRLIFGESYLLYIVCGVALHALNGVLLVRLLQRLLHSFPAAPQVASVLGLLFVSSALHSEVLQWAFEQSLLLSTTALLLGVNALVLYLERRSKGALLLFSVMALVAPLCFGNGFAYPGYALCILLSVIVLRDDIREKINLRILLLLLSCCGAGLGLAAVGYLLNASTAGHGLEQTKPFGDIPELLSYLFVGAEFGTLLRGLGLFPSLELGAASALVPSILGIRPEMLLALIGFAASGILISLCLGKIPRKKLLGLFAIGHLWLLGSMVLPALARWQLGLTQALSLRYCYTAFPGLLMIVAPFVWCLLNTKHRFGRMVGFVLLSLILTSQVFASTRFTYFTDRGEENRFYVASLRDWNVRRAALKARSFEANQTVLHGAFPLMPAGLTPGKHPDEISRVLNYLSGGQP